MEDFDFSGKIVLVTGASRGIGKEIAQKFASLGATVVGTATTAEGASKIEESLNGKGFGLVLNALQLDTVAQVVDQVVEKCGAAPDILVNNAGITRDTLFMRMKDVDFDEVIACNLTAAVRLSKACIGPMMKKRAGRIISITSVVGETGNAGQCNYAASKAGIIGFTRSLAQEVGSRGITVNCVAPGFIETDMTKVLSDEQKKAYESRIPLRKLGQVADIANAVVFLASDWASYITGTTLDVNGGMRCA